MVVTLTTTLPFVNPHASLEMQSEACTPTKTLNGTQAAITSGTGTFEQPWRLDAPGNWKTFNMETTEANERLAKMNAERGSELLNGTLELNQTRTTNKANEIIFHPFSHRS